MAQSAPGGGDSYSASICSLAFTPPRASSKRDPPPPGEGKKITFSRRDARPRDAVQRVKYFAGHHRVTPEPAVGPVFGSIMLGEYNNE